MDDTAILEQELIENHRVVYHGDYGFIHISRPTPSVERKIAEERRRIYHKDLKDPDVLTSEEVTELLTSRGVWSADHSKRLEQLTAESANLMARLTALGFETPAKLYVDVVKMHTKLNASYGENMTTEVSDAIERVFNFQDNLQTADLKILRENAPNTDVHELLDKAETLALQADLSKTFSEVKQELGKLMETHNRYFRDTIESRAMQVERMAKIFYCMLTPEGNPLWEKFEDMWDEDPDHINWLSAQLYYFEYGITDDYAKALEVHGFMGRVTNISDSSESSPGHPMSNSDGEPQESEPLNSSVADIPTT